MGQVSTQEWLDNIQNTLLAKLTENSNALPKGFNKERFSLNCITVIRDMLKDSKKREQLQKVDPQSIPICLLKGAYLGLDFFNGECYAIPYGGEIKFQTDYKGEIKLCKKYSKNPIRDIFAKLVREEDLFEESVEDGKQGIMHKPIPFSNKKIIGAYAIVYYKDGSMMYETMGVEEMENVRNTYSKAKDSQAWKSSTGEMYKKTVLRRLKKWIDLDFDNIEQSLAFEDGGDAVFENGLPGRNASLAIEEKEKPVDVFAGKTAQKKEPVPVKASEIEEFQQFEEQYSQGMPPSSGENFMIPDGIDEELPFK